MTNQEMAALLGEAADEIESDDAELARLQASYPDYRVWRTNRYWMASALVEGVTPTLLEDTADALEERLRNPGRPIGDQYMLGDM